MNKWRRKSLRVRTAGMLAVLVCASCDGESSDRTQKNDGGAVADAGSDAGQNRDSSVSQADSGPISDSGTHDAADDDGGEEPPTLADCDDIEAEVLAMVEDNRECTDDSDCIVVDTECTLMTTRDHCSGAYYVNLSIDVGRFVMLDDELTECHYAQPIPDTGDHCGGCAEEPCAPACRGGMCTEALESECYRDE